MMRNRRKEIRLEVERLAKDRDEQIRNAGTSRFQRELKGDGSIRCWYCDGAAETQNRAKVSIMHSIGEMMFLYLFDNILNMNRVI